MERSVKPRGEGPPEFWAPPTPPPCIPSMGTPGAPWSPDASSLPDLMMTEPTATPAGPSGSARAKVREAQATSSAESHSQLWRAPSLSLVPASSLIHVECL